MSEFELVFDDEIETPKTENTGFSLEFDDNQPDLSKVNINAINNSNNPIDAFTTVAKYYFDPYTRTKPIYNLATNVAKSAADNKEMIGDYFANLPKATIGMGMKLGEEAKSLYQKVDTKLKNEAINGKDKNDTVLGAISELPKGAANEVAVILPNQLSDVLYWLGNNMNDPVTGERNEVSDGLLRFSGVMKDVSEYMGDIEILKSYAQPTSNGDLSWKQIFNLGGHGIGQAGVMVAMGKTIGIKPAYGIYAVAGGAEEFRESFEKEGDLGKANTVATLNAASTYLIDKWLDPLPENIEKGIKLTRRQIAEEIATSAIKEPTAEVLQQVYAENLTRKIGIDPTQDLYEGTIEAAIGALFGGVVMGGAAGMSSYNSEKSYNDAVKKAKELGATDAEIDQFKRATQEKIKQHPEAFSAVFQKVADENLKQIDEFVKKYGNTEEARKAMQTKTELEEVYNTVNKSLTDAGVNADVANADAKVWQGIALFGAQETGLSPMEYLKQNAPRVEKARFDEFKKRFMDKTADSSALDVLRQDINRLKKGVSRKAGKGLRLSQFIKQQGGIKDDRGDIKSMGASVGLLNKNGISLDEATRLAWEAGYIQGTERPEINQLLDLLSDDLGNKPVYTFDDQMKGDDRQYYLELERAIDEAGADINKDSVEEIAKKLDAYSAKLDSYNRPAGYDEALDDFIPFQESINLAEKISKIDADRLAFERKNINPELNGRENEKVKAVKINRYFSDKKASKDISLDDVIAALDKTVEKNANGNRILKNKNGETVTLSNKAISKMFNTTRDRFDAQNIGGILGKESIANIADIFDSALLIKTTKDEKHGTKNKIRRYANAIESDGEKFIVKITVKEMANNRKELTDIEIENNNGKDLAAYDLKVGRKNTAEGNSSADKSAASLNGNDIIINDLIDFVNTYTAKTINIDGKERSTTNSNDMPIAKTEEGLKAFYEWFGDSKVVDEQGRPLVVYHSTDVEFSVFDKTKADSSVGLPAFYFSSSEQYSREYGSITMPAYLKAENVFNIGKDVPDGWYELKTNEERVDLLKKQGYDGVFDYNAGATEYAVFEPNQIKSTSNRGTYSLDDENIYYQREISDEELEADLAEFDKILDSFAEENKEYYNKKGKFEDAKKIQKKYQDFFMYNIADASNPYGRHDPFYFEYDGKKDITNIWTPKKLEKGSNIILYSGAEQIFVPVEKFDESKFKKLGYKRQKMYDEGSRDVYTLDKDEKSDRSADFTRKDGKYIKNSDINYQSAFAGSRVDYDQPSLEAIGSGEGAQAHGWGLYYALNKDVAERYREKLTNNNKGIVYFGDKIIPPEIANNLNGNSLYQAEQGNFEPIKENIKFIVNSWMEGSKWAKERISEGKKLIKYIDENEKLSISSLLEYIENDIESKWTWKSVIKAAKEQAKKEGTKANIQIIKSAIEQHIAPFIEEETRHRNAAEELLASTDENFSNMMFLREKGQVHEVDLPENPYLLDEQKPFSEQSDIVKKGIIDTLDKMNLSVEEKEKFKNNIENKRDTGKEIYEELVLAMAKSRGAGMLYSSKENMPYVSKALAENGVKGITYWGRQDGRCFVIFNPADVKVIQKFYQDNNQSERMPKGAFMENLDSNGVIYLFEKADASTFMHETAHFFRKELRGFNTARSKEMLKQLDAWENAEFDKRYNIRQDLNGFVVTDKVGNIVYGAERPFESYEWAKDYAKNELFARGFEQFLREGKAPNNYLKQAFRSFWNWLRHLYKAAQDLNVELSDDVRKIYGDILGGQDLDFYLSAPVDEVLEQRVKTNEEVEKYMDDVIKQAQAEQMPKVSAWWQEKTESLKGKQEWWNKAMVPISTRAKRVNQSLRNRLRAYDFRVNNKYNEYMAQVKPFLDKWATFNEQDSIAFDLALKNGYMKKQLEIVKKYNAYDEFVQVKNLLNNLFDQAIDLGIELGYTADYFPRQIEDVEGFMKYLHGSPFESQMRRALYDVDPDNMFTMEEKAEFINKYLRGFVRNDLNKPLIGNTKDRRIEVVDAELNKFYKPSIQALISYIDGMNNSLESRRFWGFKYEDINQSIGALTADLIDRGMIRPDQDQEVKELLTARFRAKGVTNRWLKRQKNFSYIYTMGGLNSAITQIDDISVALYKAGFWNTVNSIFSKKKAGLSREELGLEKIGQEFAEASTSSKAVSAVFKATGLDKIDAFGKNVLINATFDKFQKLANTNEDELRRLIEPTLEQETNDTIEDIKKGIISENVKLLMFNELADMQPISLSEMPEWYLTSGNGRVFYMLKTFALKRIDIFRNECFDKIKNGQTKEGLQNLFRLAMLMVICGMAKDMIIDMLYGRDIDLTDMFVNNLLGLTGIVTKYSLYRTRDEGFTGFLATTAIPPLLAPTSDIISDLYKSLFTKQGKDISDYEIWKGVPIVGRIYYWWFGGGRTKIEKKNKPKLK